MEKKLTKKPTKSAVKRTKQPNIRLILELTAFGFCIIDIICGIFTFIIPTINDIYFVLFTICATLGVPYIIWERIWHKNIIEY